MGLCNAASFGDHLRPPGMPGLVADDVKAQGITCVAGFDGLVSNAARLRHAVQPRDGIAGAAGDLRGLGERPLSAGLHDPEIDLGRLCNVQRIGHQAIVDADHG